MEINGKVYRNLPQQVLKNQEDILALQSQSVDAYTKAEADAKFETKEVHQADVDSLHSQIEQADTEINRVVGVLPTDVAIKDGKLGLEHDTTWLTNQNAITLGEHLTYDSATNTLDAVGGGATLPAGTINDPFKLNLVQYYSSGDYNITYSSTNLTYLRIGFDNTNGLNFELQQPSREARMPFIVHTYGGYNTTGCFLEAGGINYKNTPNGKFRIYNYNKYNGDMFVPVLEHPSADGKYLLQITRNNEYSYHYDWVAGGSGGGLPAVPTDKTESYYLDATYDSVTQTSSVAWSALKKTYRHFVTLSGSGTGYAGELYITIPSTNGLVINSLTDLDTVMTSFVGMVECSGFYDDTGNNACPIVRLFWNSRASSSTFAYLKDGALVEMTLGKLTTAEDKVMPA